VLPAILVLKAPLVVQVPLVPWEILVLKARKAYKAIPDQPVLRESKVRLAILDPPEQRAVWVLPVHKAFKARKEIPVHKAFKVFREIPDHRVSRAQSVILAQLAQQAV
jgi:hypothetical protein